MPRYSYGRHKMTHHKRKSRTNRVFKAKVKRIISQSDEAKFVDTDLDDDTVPIGGTSMITPLCLIASGIEDTHRIGDQVKLISIEMKYFCLGEVDGNGIDSLCRIIIFRAKKNINGTLPVVTDLLTSDILTALRNTAGGADMSDFKVYLDKTFVLQRKTTAIQRVMVHGKFFRSLGGLKCTWRGAAASIVVAETGQLFLLRMTQQPTTFQPAWTVNIRVRFKEL